MVAAVITTAMVEPPCQATTPSGFANDLEVYVEDLKEEFVKGYVFQALRTSLAYEKLSPSCPRDRDLLDRSCGAPRKQVRSSQESILSAPTPLSAPRCRTTPTGWVGDTTPAAAADGTPAAARMPIRRLHPCPLSPDESTYSEPRFAAAAVAHSHATPQPAVREVFSYEVFPPRSGKKHREREELRIPSTSSSAVGAGGDAACSHRQPAGRRLCPPSSTKALGFDDSSSTSEEQTRKRAMKALCFDDAATSASANSAESRRVPTTTRSAARRAAALAVLSLSSTGSSSNGGPTNLRAHMMHHLIVSARKALRFEEVEDTPAGQEPSSGSGQVRHQLGLYGPTTPAARTGSRPSIGSSTAGETPTANLADALSPLYGAEESREISVVSSGPLLEESRDELVSSSCLSPEFSFEELREEEEEEDLDIADLDSTISPVRRRQSNCGTPVHQVATAAWEEQEHNAIDLEGRDVPDGEAASRFAAGRSSPTGSSPCSAGRDGFDGAITAATFHMFCTQRVQRRPERLRAGGRRGGQNL
eukprot:gnl/TRDRNA2_/TRDRNA2_183694_c0_seq1.p1 gnl/TRDRNA2_/TRDRNA2_183694_c0~~gnl/TRDRNA2_/TRDRNA2_183694_c0_seq1.p1  ORF type:complete len:557 (-),score=75.47 gnl/TRDRNA2_/TRDRNA2_183694_c0_seq1:232-1830(-)